MRIKPLATILLTAFVLVAVAVILARGPRRTPVGSGEPVGMPDVTTNAPQRSEADATPAGTARREPSPTTESRGLATTGGGRDRAVEAQVAASSPRSDAPLPAFPARKVVATYFHGDVRCATCRKVEGYAREAVEEGFSSEVASGAVEFRAVNLDVPENAHFVRDYQLTNKSVVVTEEVDGVVVRWAKLDEVWSLVGDRDRYHVYVQDAVRGYLEP